MASAKIVALAVRTAAKPIANWLKSQATQHDAFKDVCISLAQRMHRTETKMRQGLLNVPSKDIRPLNDAKAVSNGANALAEGFLFMVAAGLIVGEAYRGSRSTAKRKDYVDEQLESLQEEVSKLKERWKEEEEELMRRTQIAEARNEHLSSIIQTVIDAGTRNGWMNDAAKADNGSQITPMLSLQDWHTYDPSRTSAAGGQDVLSISNDASS
ncbi:hypothetical protein NliqN6_1725 [Naganishia liquefaciens]|uniref:OPA3-domain-containing protein n=1 Tax=Naganishia liquefaciens TaxID=104408 RepID=A0A8H3TR21_9TREE|nr:hypothetical protein NliqN6_1725 [Naganishia liquefaciens]